MLIFYFTKYCCIALPSAYVHLQPSSNVSARLPTSLPTLDPGKVLKRLHLMGDLCESAL